MSYTGRAEQLAYLDFVALRDYDAKPREIRIREAAADAITRSETYTESGYRGAVMVPHERPYVARYREGDTLYPAPRAYVEYTVKLVPELQGSLDVAQILAENQIRAAWP